MYSNVTENCKNVIARSSRTFAASFVIDQTKYSDIKKINLSVPSTANGRVTIGGTISNSLEIITEKVSVLCGQKMEVFNSVKLDSGEYEDIPMGHFKITSARTKDNLTTIVASGLLSTETSLGYFSELEYPATTIQILNEISQAIGVEIETDNLEAIYVETKPEGYTHREVIGFIAAMHAMNAIETRNGTIAFKWFVDCAEDIFTDKTDSPELSNSLFLVNKFECATGSNTWTKGNGSTGIVISNPLMTEEMADYVWEKLQGFSYRPGTFNIKSGTPCVDIWDSFLHNNERVVATELQYLYDGGLQNTYKSSGETETSDRHKGPLATALERYYAELLIVKEIAADSMTVDEADIRYARMDQLDAIEANITSAVVDSIDGRYATFDLLAAVSARVNTLEVSSLTANSAIITELQSGVAKVNNLIFGAAGGTSIQTEFSNSVIAMLGEAQIKSAMIESVSVDKLTAGTIYTDDVTIKSKSGNMLLKDNTLQISDGVRTRVQIGKDASNDYNMYVWDKSGNIMFDALGLTEDGITRQIIRDEVVKDDANINAKKLDIDSLFTEINGSTNTIKSTKVYFDGENQTLDAVFESMTTTVDGLQSTQSSQGTQITAIQGQISSKIWQQDIDTAVDDLERDVTTLSTQYSTLNQTVTGLSSTVGSHTTQINSLDTRVDSAESSITQHAKEIDLRVKADSVIAAINLSPETVLISAKHIDLIGEVTFSSLDNSTQSKINTANTNASNAVSIANTASTNATTALSTANAANTAANNALLATEVENIVGNVKKFKNVCGYTSDAANVKGYLIITTPIQPNRMVTMHISGYNYVNASETIDLTVGFYNYTGSFTSVGYVNKGSFPITSVKVAKVSSSDTRAVVIIGTATTVWQYPKIIVDEVITGYSTVAPDSYKNGFSATITAALSTAYVHTITLSGTDVTALTKANNTAIANWCYNSNTTYIDGANIYTGTITSKQIDVEDLFAQNITATGTITGLNLVSTDGTEAGTITLQKGHLRIGSETTNVSMANAGISFNYSNEQSGRITNVIGNKGLEIAAAKRLYIRVNEEHPLLFNESDSYANMIHVKWPTIFDDDIYPVNIDCFNITCTDVRIRNGISLSELNSNYNDLGNVHTLSTNVWVIRAGLLRILYLQGLKIDNLSYLASHFSPSHNLSVPITVTLGGKFYNAFLAFAVSSGWAVSYYTDGNGAATPASGSTLYGIIPFSGTDF